MLNDEICKLREKLNESILHEKDYSVTYEISVQLDELIAQYYNTQIKLINRKKQNNFATCASATEPASIR